MDNTSVLFQRIREKFPKFYLTEVINDSLKMSPENDDGYVEYKRTLIDCSDKKAEKYATQMQWRIKQNIKSQFATYYIGVDDDGEIVGLSDEDAFKCIDIFLSISSAIEASIIGIKLIRINNLVVVEIKVKLKKIKNDYLVEFEQNF